MSSLVFKGIPLVYCKKCGHNEQDVTYIKRPLITENDKEYDDHLYYKCKLCQYSWRTPTLDANQE